MRGRLVPSKAEFALALCASLASWHATARAQAPTPEPPPAGDSAPPAEEVSPSGAAAQEDAPPAAAEDAAKPPAPPWGAPAATPAPPTPPPGDAPAAPPPPGDSTAPSAAPSPFAPIDAPKPPPVRLGAAPEAFDELWVRRREALARGDGPAAEATLAEFLDTKDLAGWPSSTVHALALARECRAAVTAGDLQFAMKLAAAAVAMAPMRPEPYEARARVQWALVKPWAAAQDTARAAWQVLGDPIEARLRAGNGVVAALLAFTLAAVVFALVTLYRHFRTLALALHGVMPRFVARAHATVLLAALVLAPLAAPIGWVWTLLAWLTVPSRYFERRERAGALAVFAFVVALPFVLPRAMTYLTYPGSRAHDIYLAATDMGAKDAAARVLAQPKHSPSELLALGLRDRWAGRLDSALAWLRRATEAGLQHPAIHTYIGNIHFQLDDKPAAIEAYGQALKQDPQHVAALFNLSRAYFALAEHQKAGDAHRQATTIDYARVERFAQEAKTRGPLYVASDEPPRALLAVYNGRTPALHAAADDVWTAFAGRAPAQFVVIGAGLAAIIVVLTSLGRARQAAGNAAPAKAAEGAQARKGGVAPLQRIRQEIEVHRHQVRLVRMRRVVALFLAGAGQLVVGRSVAGLLFLSLFLTSVILLAGVLGWLPAPVPLAQGPWLVSATLYALVALVSYGASLSDAHREDR